MVPVRISSSSCSQVEWKPIRVAATIAIHRLAVCSIAFVKNRSMNDGCSVVVVIVFTATADGADG
ncbi:hypothetical protein AK37_13414 [Rhodococcus pyridinivorans AK37]|uniref:Uncharacterized protein n=1 Tax=Rhodococcus pyridinivorans AK37 TaxID=1114960 RepID=H0JSM4_9NOCA|nr:hypothetical protein AK37_13414 [Rhodococcus pyridinivorans AK37]